MSQLDSPKRSVLQVFLVRFSPLYLSLLDHVDSERSKEDEWLLNSVSFRSLAYDAMLLLSLQLPIPLLVMAVQLVLLKRMLVSKTGSGSNASGNQPPFTLLLLPPLLILLLRVQVLDQQIQLQLRQELIHSFFFLSSAPSTSSLFLPASKLSCFGICLSSQTTLLSKEEKERSIVE